MDLYAINYWPKVLKDDRPRSFISPTMYIVVAQKWRGIEGFGFKWLCIDMSYWLSNMAIWILHTIVEHPMTVSISWRWASMECQQFLVLHVWQSKACKVMSFQRGSIGHLNMLKRQREARWPILNMSINGVSTIFGLASWIITGLCNGIYP